MLFLLLGMGISWMIVYLLIIYRSFKDKTFGMPFIALALNISWEFIYSFIIRPEKAGIQTYINTVWFILDLFILYTFIKYGKEGWKDKPYTNWFYPYLFFTICFSFLLLFYMQAEFNELAITYSAFIMNVVISALFIQMIISRNSLRGQSFGIAIFKLTGSFFATLILFMRFSIFLQLLGILCFFLDIIYLALILEKYKSQKLHLVTRIE